MITTILERSIDAVKLRTSARDHRLYGFSIRSEIPLTYAETTHANAPDISIGVQSAEWFARVHGQITSLDRSSGWYDHAELADGSEYLRWPSLFEFVVSADGHDIAARCLDDLQAESFQTYLLGWVLSCGLLKQGHEPLHATAVVVHGKAVALLGTSGQGKSTLAAAFLHAGHRVLTDDLLMIQRGNGQFLAYPGPPRVKLFPEAASRFQSQKASLGPMNPDSDKLIVPLDAHETSSEPLPLAGFVVLETTETGAPPVTLDQLSAHDSLLALVGATFNDRVRTPARLQRQFAAVTGWASELPMLRTRYPREFDAAVDVQQAIAKWVSEA